MFHDPRREKKHKVMKLTVWIQDCQDSMTIFNHLQNVLFYIFSDTSSVVLRSRWWAQSKSPPRIHVRTQRDDEGNTICDTDAWHLKGTAEFFLFSILACLLISLLKTGEDNGRSISLDKLLILCSCFNNLLEIEDILAGPCDFKWLFEG